MLKQELPLQLLFIFDTSILQHFNNKDHRLNFIYDTLKELNQSLKSFSSSILIKKGNPIEVWKELMNNYPIHQVGWNEDYEPETILRDRNVKNLLASNKIKSSTYKDHVLQDYSEVLKKDGSPYVVFTPYYKQWIKNVEILSFQQEKIIQSNWSRCTHEFPSKKELEIQPSNFESPIKLSKVLFDTSERDIPSIDSSRIGVHLRFGTISVREVYRRAYLKKNLSLIRSLAWRDFFISILRHYPKVVQRSFKPKYDAIKWVNDKSLFEKWTKGETGYPLVDAGMKQLVKEGFMHNRVRMITASFLVKHLLIDWKWGDNFFKEYLYDYELASNNGNWQWVAGTGVDAAPYFRVFNPITQQQKFDKELVYIKKYIPNYDPDNYLKPIVDHREARVNCIDHYKYYLQKDV